jgi:glycosyltransferase involved in cell wall biosynthesis
MKTETAPVQQTARTFEDLGTLSGQSIVCFAKDWSEDPTSCNHVLQELAKRNRVLWLNSISTRSPNLTSGRDLGKIVRKVKSFFQKPRQVGEQMWVYTPLVLPFHHKSWAVKANRWLLRTTVRRLGRRFGMHDFQLWTFVPTSADYVGHLGASMIVYYCTDNWSQFSSVDGERIGGMVQSLATQADVVFATSHLLVEKLQPQNAETHLAAHGVKYTMFAAATQPETPIPTDLAALPQPVLGFYGLIEDWLDLDLIAYLAERHPEWSFAFVGRTCVDVSSLSRFPNVHFLGRKPHTELPNYCKGFSIGLIPHKVNELTRHMNPIKLREYLSAGLPVVATALPEVRYYAEHCTIAENYAEFEAGIVHLLATETPESRRARSRQMQSETWENKVAVLGDHVLRVQKTRGGRA